MGRTSHSNYIEAARQVLGELGGTLSSRDLVAAAQERGLIGNGTWVYHNFLRKVRDSDEFDTTRRGYVTMMAAFGAPVAEEVPGVGPIAEAEVEAPVADPGDNGPILEEAKVAAPDFAEAPVNVEVNEDPMPEPNPFVENA